MFGLTVFSQSPFAALGGNQYALAIAEAVTMAELAKLGLTEDEVNALIGQ